MRLSELTGEANEEMTAVSLAESVEVTGLTADSRKVGPGYLFAALPGARGDGRDFIDEAVAKGAVAVLAPRGTALRAYDHPVALVEDDNPRRRLAILAAHFYDAQPELVAAVTGTNGKTSVADFTRQIWRHAGLECASGLAAGTRPSASHRPAARRIWRTGVRRGRRLIIAAICGQPAAHATRRQCRSPPLERECGWHSNVNW